VEVLQAVVTDVSAFTCCSVLQAISAVPVDITTLTVVMIHGRGSEGEIGECSG